MHEWPACAGVHEAFQSTARWKSPFPACGIGGKLASSYSELRGGLRLTASGGEAARPLASFRGCCRPAAAAIPARHAGDGGGLPGRAAAILVLPTGARLRLLARTGASSASGQVAGLLRLALTGLVVTVARGALGRVYQGLAALGERGASQCQSSKA
jgi:hypothetical protein